MNQRLLLLLFTAMLGAVGITGCQHCCRRAGYTASAPPCCDPAPPGRWRPLHALMPRRTELLPGPPPPTRQDVLGPPAATLPGLPPPGYPSAPSAPLVPPPDSRSFAPPPTPPEPTWRPSPDAVPTPPPPESPREGARLYPPESPEPPRPPARPDPAPEKPASPAMPVGIAQFAMVKNRVASGLKPSLEGLDWLKTNGYRTVVHVRWPGEDDSADRRQVEERRGMKFVSIELSPQNVRAAAEQFNHLLADASCPPVFVYDRDGTLQGFLWFLHFRIVDLASSDEARIRARSFGLREPATDEQRDLWLAVQKYLSGQ